MTKIGLCGGSASGRTRESGRAIRGTLRRTRQARRRAPYSLFDRMRGDVTHYLVRIPR